MGDGADKPYYKDIGEKALAECDELENEMNLMFKELDDMQNLIKDNKDLKTYETLKDTTWEVVDVHMSAYSELKDKILDITKDADQAMDNLNFYGDDDDDDFDAKSQKRQKARDFA